MRKDYQTTKGLIADGVLVEEGFNYRTDDGRLIERYEGRGKRRNSYVLKWKIENRLYNTLWDAYKDDGYGTGFYAYLIRR